MENSLNGGREGAKKIYTYIYTYDARRKDNINERTDGQICNEDTLFI